MGVKLLLQMMLVMLLLFIKGAFAQISYVAKPGCEERCGDLLVPYPIGIGANCSAAKTMNISCDKSFHPPKALIQTRIVTESDETHPLYLEVLEISVVAGTIRINYPITTECTNTDNDRLTDQLIDLYPPFTFSNTENRFTGMGCDNLALLFGGDDIVGGCASMCQPSVKNDNSCFGVNCCQLKFPPSLQSVSPQCISFNDDSASNCSQGPRYAFIVDQKWFGELEDIHSVKTMEYVPAVLNWRTNGSCQSFGAVDPPPPNGTLCGINALCTNQSLCSCEKGYEGNPYLRDGCQGGFLQ